MLRTATQQAAERRQNLAQGEASAASETLGHDKKRIIARFSGRQSSFVLATLLAVIFFPSCKNQRSISSGAGGWPASSSAPAEVSSSAQVVKVTTPAVQAAVGVPADTVVRLSITPGYHVNANPATFPYLIATAVKTIPEPDGFCARIDKPIYPPPIQRTFAFEELPLAVYEGEIEIKMSLRVPTSKDPGCYGYPQPGARGSIPIEVRVQACDNEKCFPPATLTSAIAVEVK